jgi:hypothetical protein
LHYKSAREAQRSIKKALDQTGGRWYYFFIMKLYDGGVPVRAQFGRTANDKRQTTNDKRQTTNDKRQTTNDKKIMWAVLALSSPLRRNPVIF